MDERSVTRPAPPPTRAIVADEAFCAQAAALLMCDPGPVRDAFLGEPAEEVLEMVRWALSHEDDEGFDPRRCSPPGSGSARGGPGAGGRPRLTGPPRMEDTGGMWTPTKETAR